jgi:diketogulonate reductase-like aldo/keto reductase
MPMTALGRSDLRVSRLALGSWRTYERISRDQGVRVMRAAREAGINFLDDARYRHPDRQVRRGTRRGPRGGHDRPAAVGARHRGGS